MPISIHAPRTGSDVFAIAISFDFIISIHAPRTGSDGNHPRNYSKAANFNPRSPHGERRFRGGAHLTAWGISIHAPRTGSDVIWVSVWARRNYFNPRSPHGERLNCFRHRPCIDTFQSTLPARGATRRLVPQGLHIYISIHAPRTGSDSCVDVPESLIFAISIHAPRTGSDGISPHCINSASTFQSTLPARGATYSTHRHLCGYNHFNPRSPHGERRPRDILELFFTHFNPRSPHGERPCASASCVWRAAFQSTLPARGATRWRGVACVAGNISIHAPRTGSDKSYGYGTFRDKGFQSTLPARGATRRCSRML